VKQEFFMNNLLFSWWSAFSLKLLFIEKPFHQISIGVPFHQMSIKGAHSSNELTHNSPIFGERAPSGFSPNAFKGWLFTEPALISNLR
jgi:hypothetical protein